MVNGYDYDYPVDQEAESSGNTSAVSNIKLHIINTPYFTIKLVLIKPFSILQVTSSFDSV